MLVFHGFVPVSVQGSVQVFSQAMGVAMFRYAELNLFQYLVKRREMLWHGQQRGQGNCKADER